MDGCVGVGGGGESGEGGDAVEGGGGATEEEGWGGRPSVRVGEVGVWRVVSARRRGRVSAKEARKHGMARMAG